eukprot:9079880-Alexandrium_andersonii.AAC.1
MPLIVSLYWWRLRPLSYMNWPKPAKRWSPHSGPRDAATCKPTPRMPCSQQSKCATFSARCRIVRGCRFRSRRKSSRGRLAGTKPSGGW